MGPFIVKDNNIHITDSYVYRKSAFKDVFSLLREKYPTNSVLNNRSDCSMSREWATHNLLYSMHIAQSRTKDVDLEYPQKWYYKIGYFIVGTIALLIIE